MHWRDLELERYPGEWQGLELTIPPRELASLPPLHVEAAIWKSIRVIDPGGPLLWGHQHQCAEGLWWLAADRARTSPVPLISAADLRALPAALPTRDYWAGWARWFARALHASPLTPLRPGRWALAFGDHGPFRRRWQSSWGAWPLTGGAGLKRCLVDDLGWTSWVGGAGHVLRLGQRADLGRVKAWRKRARDGTLPPVLVMLVRGMGAWVILDGHARLAAALEERAPVPLLHLFVADSDPHQGISPSTFAWPIPGGWRRWREEVVGRLAAIGRPPDHALVDGLAPYEAVARGRPVD